MAASFARSAGVPPAVLGVSGRQGCRRSQGKRPMGGTGLLLWTWANACRVWPRGSRPGLLPSPLQGLGMFCAPDPGLKPGALCRCPFRALRKEGESAPTESITFDVI